MHSSGMIAIVHQSFQKTSLYRMAAKVYPAAALAGLRRSSRIAGATANVAPASRVDSTAKVAGAQRKVARSSTAEMAPMEESAPGASTKKQARRKRVKLDKVSSEELATSELSADGRPADGRAGKRQAKQGKAAPAAAGPVADDGKRRCGWSSMYTGAGSALYLQYHDEEWGVPQRDDRALFELLVLEGAQAGLSWATILNKRAHYRKVFDNFEPQKVAQYGAAKIGALLADPGIVRNLSKVTSAVENARLVLEIQKEFGSFHAYLWEFVGTKPVANKFSSLSDIPVKSAESEGLSKDLRSRGFRFVGPTIMYAYMQAVGMVNDHLVDCFRHADVERLHQTAASKGKR